MVRALLLPGAFFAGSLALAAQAPLLQGTDNSAKSVRAQLTEKPADCALVAENAARLISQGPEKTLYIIAEWETLCRDSEGWRLFELSRKIHTVDARSAELTPRLWQQMRYSPYLAAGVSADGEWARLVTENARRAEARSADGKLIKNWYLAGSHAVRNETARTPTATLHRLYLDERREKEENLNFSLAVTTGAWIPSGNLARLGNNPWIGYHFGAGYARFTAAIALDFRFGGTPEDYRFLNPNTGQIENTNVFFGLNVGGDLRYEFLQLGDFAFFVAGGMGYDMITHYVARRYSGQRPAYSESLNLNGGLVLRWYFTEERGGFLEAMLRYHSVSMGTAGEGGDDLSGSYITAGAAAGYRIVFDN